MTREWLDDHPQAAQSLLRAAWNGRAPVRCCCRGEGVPMHIARGYVFVLKRNPGSGALHAPSCPAYAVDSTLDQPAKADWRQPDRDGRVRVPLATPLYRLDGRGEAPPGTGEMAPVATTKPRVRDERVDLAALLQYLWHEAGFNLWRPAMAGWRDWYVVRRYLLEAAAPVLVRAGVALTDVLFVPERFRQADRVERAARAAAVLEVRCRHEQGRRRLALVLAEVKRCTPSRFSHLLRLKHAAGLAFWVESRLWAGALKACRPAAATLAGKSSSRVVVLMSVERTASGNFNAVDVALMATSLEWIPILEADEGVLIQRLIEERRAFVRPLVASKAEHPPSAVLIDTQIPHPLFLLPGSEPATLPADAWVWHPEGVAPGPALPPPRPAVATQHATAVSPSAPAAD